MTTNYSDLEKFSANLPDASGMRFGIVVAEWNSSITDVLLMGALDMLKKCGATEEHIMIQYVPGSIELTYASKILAQHTNPDAVIVLGCVIEGETRHFDYVCDSVTQGITQLNLQFPMPFIFGVITTRTMQQAIERAGGRHGNKGAECAITAVRMAELKNKFKS